MNQQEKQENSNQQSEIEDLTLEEGQASDVKGSRGIYTYDLGKQIKI